MQRTLCFHHLKHIKWCRFFTHSSSVSLVFINETEIGITDNHELDALDRMNQPNSIVTDVQNTQVKTGAEGYSPEPHGELDDLPDTGLPDSSHNNGAIKHPIQVQSANEYEMGCEPLPRQETEKGYKKKLSLENNTVDRSDIGNGVMRY